MPKCKYCGEKSPTISKSEIAEKLRAIIERTREPIGPEPCAYGHDLALLEMHAKWAAQSKLSRARLTLAGLLEMMEGAHVHCASFNPDPEPQRIDEPYACTGCACEVGRCGPPLWETERKCCPECSHTREQFERWESAEFGHGKIDGASV